VPAQSKWRFCIKCESLFFDSGDGKSNCPAPGGGLHLAAGFNFVLPHDVPETPTAQANWRFCHRCESMFFNSGDGKSHCPAPGGGPHDAAGFNFVLPHDVFETPTAQANWRFCHRCESMFFNSGDGKSHCPAPGGGLHDAAGFNFVLPHDVPENPVPQPRQSAGFDSGTLTVPGSLPLSGSCHLVVFNDGTWDFASHAHDAGFDNIHYIITAIFVPRNGKVYTFEHNGGLEGTGAGIPFHSPRRGDDFNSGTVNSQRITEPLDDILAGKLTGMIVGNDATADAVQSAFGTILTGAGVAAAALVVGLLGGSAKKGSGSGSSTVADAEGVPGAIPPA